jgi:hypothetical protein
VKFTKNESPFVEEVLLVTVELQEEVFSLQPPDQMMSPILKVVFTPVGSAEG